MKEQFIEFLFSMKWLWAIVVIMLWNIVNSYIKLGYNKLALKKEELIKSLNYDEEKIIKHVDYIITEEMDRYIVMTLTPKNIYYINTNEQKKLTEHLIEVIPDRLSQALLEQLSLIYNQDYIGEFLGQYIYARVLELVLTFNTNGLGDNKALLAAMQSDKPVELSN